MSGAHAAEQRWQHAWAAFVLGAIAVIALGLIAFVLTTSPVHTHNAAPPVLLTEVPSHSAGSPAPRTSRVRSPAQSSAPSSTGAATLTSAVASTTLPPSTSARAVVRRSGPTARPPADRCTASAPCVVGGTGQVEDALTSYRRRHGAGGGVSAVVTAAAQRCAVTGGDGQSCADPFAVARERQQSGPDAIGDIGSGYGNWLLDPGLRSVDVGWAYDPRTGQYVCVLIARM